VHTGSETIRPSTLKRFADAFTPYGFDLNSFYPGYGLAEATLIATTRSSNQKPTFLTVSPQELSQNRIKENIEGISLTGCGLPIQGTDLAIVDPETGLESPPDHVGEIWLSSESIAQGYWQKEEETQQTFKAILSNREEKTFLRTGDLGFLKDGELFITGRIKELIVIRGENYYPQDIELVFQQSHDRLKINSSAAFSVEIEGKEELIIFQELEKVNEKQINFNEIIAAIRESVLREYEISIYGIYLLKRGHLPKTSSGKIQRNLCRQMFLENTVEAIATWTRQQVSLGQGLPKTGIESQLLAIFTEVLEFDKIGVEDNFFDLGIDSLLFLPLFSQIEEQFEMTISFEKIIENPTISQLANLITQTPLLETQELYQIRINCFKVLGQIYRAKLPQAEKLSRVYNILKIQLSQTGPDFLDYTLPYGIGTRFIRWFCGQKWIQKIFFRDHVKAIEQCLDIIESSIPRSQVIQHNLASNFWRYWRLAALASSSPENFDRWISITGLSCFQKAYQQKKGVVLLSSHVPLRPLLMLLLDRWGIEDFTIIGSHRYILELLNLAHLHTRLSLYSTEVKKSIFYAQFYQAHQVLNRGGVVIIAPDGLRKQPGIERAFFSKKCYIGRSFMDFVISLQSVAIPVDISMELTGTVQVQFLNSLNSGDSSLVYTEQVDQLADQYWEILQTLWQDNFGNVGWDGINAFLQQSIK
jgi:acyl carrier protein/lauroyl/myristoyl acyltransferase